MMEEKIFSSRSCVIGNWIGIPEVSRTVKEDVYSISRRGDGPIWVDASEVTVLCEDTGEKDRNGRPIYVCPNGQKFVFAGHNGSPAYLASRWFDLPAGDRGHS